MYSLYRVFKACFLPCVLKVLTKKLNFALQAISPIFNSNLHPRASNSFIKSEAWLHSWGNVKIWTKRIIPSFFCDGGIKEAKYIYIYNTDIPCISYGAWYVLDTFQVVISPIVKSKWVKKIYIPGCECRSDEKYWEHYRIFHVGSSILISTANSGTTNFIFHVKAKQEAVIKITNPYVEEINLTIFCCNYFILKRK